MDYGENKTQNTRRAHARAVQFLVGGARGRGGAKVRGQRGACACEACVVRGWVARWCVHVCARRGRRQTSVSVCVHVGTRTTRCSRPGRSGAGARRRQLHERRSPARAHEPVGARREGDGRIAEPAPRPRAGSRSSSRPEEGCRIQTMSLRELAQRLCQKNAAGITSRDQARRARIAR